MTNFDSRYLKVLFSAVPHTLQGNKRADAVDMLLSSRVVFGAIQKTGTPGTRRVEQKRNRLREFGVLVSDVQQ